MKILFYFGHPAHFHLFKNTINILSKKGNECQILIKKKDILEELLKASNLSYKNIQPKGRGDSKLGIAIGLAKRDYYIFKHCIKNKPDILIGTSTEIAHVGKILNIPSIVFSEDDYNVIPLFSNLCYPFASAIISPTSCNNGKWEHKSFKYDGFQKLSYLHHNFFSPDKTLLTDYFDISKPYFLLRFAKLTAHHDTGINGISTSVATSLIDKLSAKGNVYITSERKLEPQFEKYRLKINPLLIHHVLYYADIYIGDSQSMAVEAAILGTPGIRFNDFAGKINVLEELEHKYKLTFGIKTNEPEKLLKKIDELIKTKGLKAIFQQRRNKLLNDKIDVTAFMVWFIENYPESAKIMKQSPDYQYNFK